MPIRPLRPLAALLLLAAPLSAQEVSDLTIEPGAPLQGDLLVHTGDFKAARSAVPYDFCPDVPEGLRQQVAVVVFDPPYREAPQVVVTLNRMNFAEAEDTPARGVRVGARAQDVTAEGMTVVVETWCDSNMYAAEGSYFAIGLAGATRAPSPIEPVPPTPIERPPEPIDDAARPDPVETPRDSSVALPEEW